MEIVVKTYSRARTAVAAVRKFLDMHEIPSTNVEVSTYEVTTGRFAARVYLNAQGMAKETLAALEGDLLDAGVEFDTKNCEVEEDAPGEEAPATEDASTEFPAGLVEPQDKVKHIPGGAVVTLVEKKSGYVKETSTIQNATKRVWTIADAMPGAARKDVIAACRNEGIAFGTARTQYQKWFASKAK